MTRRFLIICPWVFNISFAITRPVEFHAFTVNVTHFLTITLSPTHLKLLNKFHVFSQQSIWLKNIEKIASNFIKNEKMLIKITFCRHQQPIGQLRKRVSPQILRYSMKWALFVTNYNLFWNLASVTRDLLKKFEFILTTSGRWPLFKKRNFWRQQVSEDHIRSHELMWLAKYLYLIQMDWGGWEWIYFIGLWIMDFVCIVSPFGLH